MAEDFPRIFGLLEAQNLFSGTVVLLDEPHPEQS
jgi:hypothetical protein